MPKLPTVQPDNSTLFGPSAPRRATGQDFAAGGVEQLGQALTNASLAIGKVRRATRVGQEYSSAVAELEEFAGQLTDGYMDENGNFVEPPEPEEHNTLFDDKVAKITNAVRGRMPDDATFNTFSRQFSAAALKAGVSIRKSALNQQKKKVSAETADTLLTLSQEAANAAINGDALMHGELVQQASLFIQYMEEQRVWDPEKAREMRVKFFKEVDEAHVRGLIEEDPMVAVAQLGDRDNFPNMKESERQAWIEAAYNQQNTNISRSIAEENAIHTREKRLFDRRQTELVAKFEQLMVADPEQFTPELLFAHVDELDTTTMQYYLAKAQGEDGKWTTNRDVYAELRVQAAQGVDVLSAARKAYQNRQIGRPEFDSLEAAVSSRTDASGLPTWYSRGEKLIVKRLGADMLNPPAGAAIRSAEALERFMRWAHENPDASFKDAIDEASLLGDQYQLIDTKDIEVTKGLPRFVAPGEGRDGFDWKAAAQRTKKAYAEDRTISRSIYLEELELIFEWKRVFENNGTSPVTSPVQEAPAAQTPSGHKGVPRTKKKTSPTIAPIEETVIPTPKDDKKPYEDSGVIRPAPGTKD